jgi:hypothetical protein
MLLTSEKMKIMKKTGLLSIIILVLTCSISAQNADDALRYSQIFYNGTARFISMGGAFTALGGDLSSLSQNPAGLGVFRSSEISISPQLFNIKTKAGFNGNNSEDYLYNFNLGQAGIVANLINNSSTTGLISLNVGYSFNRTNNLNQTILIDGTSNSSSLADYFADISSGFFKDELADYVSDAFLANKAWIIDTLSGSGTEYGTVYSNYGDNPPSVYGQNIHRLVTNEGYTGEHAISIGGNYSDKVYFGATLGITRLNYSSSYQHSESTDIALPSRFTSFNYLLYYDDTGTGYSLKLGAIYKPLDYLRIGFAFHSPTVFRINEYIHDNINSKFDDGGKYDWSNNPTRFSYALTTPFRVIGGVALQIKKIALVSADYEFVDYGTAKFSETGDGYDYGDKNQAIKNTLGPVSNLRLGAEVRLNRIYLRGGYGYYGKAFKQSNDINHNLDYNSLSFGAGFREQNIFIDFGYTSLSNPQQYILYDSSVETAVADINTQRNLFAVTFGYKFGY